MTSSAGYAWSAPVRVARSAPVGEVAARPGMMGHVVPDDPAKVLAGADAEESPEGFTDPIFSGVTARRTLATETVAPVLGRVLDPRR